MPINRYQINPCEPYPCPSQPGDIKRRYACAVAGTWNFQRPFLSKALQLISHNNSKEATRLQQQSLLLTHVINLLTLQYAQRKLNPTDTTCYINCDELECIRKMYVCLGFDITCVYKCFEVCGYTHTCETCQ